MSKKPAAKKRQSGNPRKRAEQAAAAAVLSRPCLKCNKAERSKGSPWCRACPDKARRRANGLKRKVGKAEQEATIIGLAHYLGVLDDEGNLVPDEDAA